MAFKINWDALGIATSLACAIHCALLPIFVTSLPIFGHELIDNSWFEVGMILLAAAIGFYSLWHGYQRHHHSVVPILLFTVGIGLLIAKQIFHSWQIAFLVPAVVCIIWAHYANYKLCRKANHCHTSDCNH
ncbi:MAG: MerC domain-containing protein [Bacteroidetes bacterium]|nr:MAG: MerC domain-containing protein [Bacteroidota bacterium]TAE67050.1 MAG: MerC domain-containing protein [Bacteroidota bacterium]TAF94246.1 MAG: MerC domain-containing protein [Bacteroidota bacterium]